MRAPCETCIAVVELTDGRKARCRWCANGRPPYDPDRADRERAARRQLALDLASPVAPATRTPTEEKTDD